VQPASDQHANGNTPGDSARIRNGGPLRGVATTENLTSLRFLVPTWSVHGTGGSSTSATVSLLTSTHRGTVRIRGMVERRESESAGVPIACVIVAALLIAYVGGYFGLCKSLVQVTDPEFPHENIRIYEARWIALAYRPLAYVESAITRKKCWTGNFTD
jgi:hypothetical protein